MSDYSLTQKEYSNLKRRLTIAKKKGPAAVVAECKHAFAIFQEKGHPDSWSNWQRAQDDAENELRRTFVRDHFVVVHIGDKHDEFGATAEDRRQLAKHGTCWGD